MPVDPVELFQTLHQFATQDPLGASLGAQAIYNAVRGAATALWHGRQEDNPFDVLWCHAVEQASQEWSPLLRDRVLQIRGAFAEGRVADIRAFRELLQDIGVFPDLAEDLLSQLSACLQEALNQAARTDPRAFQPAVMDELDKMGLVLDYVEDTNIRVRHLEEMVRGTISDGQAHRPDELRPEPASIPYEFTDQEARLLRAAEQVLSEAPDLIDQRASSTPLAETSPTVAAT